MQPFSHSLGATLISLNFIETPENCKIDIQRTEQKLSNNRIENARQRESRVDEEQERMLQRRPFEMTLEIAVGAKKKGVRLCCYNKYFKYYKIIQYSSAIGY